jgi:hypothetical protein
MKKISILLIAVSTIASAQLRLGLDVSRKGTLTPSYPSELKAAAAAMGESLPGEEDLKFDGMGISVGYDLMLLSLVGVGAELNIGSGGDSEDDHDHDDEEHSDEEIGPDNQVFVYGVAKVPVFPMVRGVIRAGLVKSFDSELDPGLGFGFGLRVKPPIFPIGLEANYTIYNFSASQDMGIGDMSIDMRQSYLNLTATYKF